MNKLSVVIIACNEEANIERCIQPLIGLADEIILVDSGSTDNTVSIAEKLGARIVPIEWKNYADARNVGADRAVNDWVLALDADEELSQELRQSVIAVMSNPISSVYKFARLTNFCGQWIRHCGWYPDWKFRLYDRTKACWEGAFVHEALDWENRQQFGVLKGDLLHYSFPTLAHHQAKMERYAQLGAEKIIAAGKTQNLSWKKWTHAAWKLFRGYLLQGGFLEGKAGWVISRGMAQEVWMKYDRARALINT